MQPATDKPKRARSRQDIVLYILSAALLITLGLAAAYGMRYGNVDESVVPGDITFTKDEAPLATIHVNDDLTADIDYLGFKMSGTLKLAGAEEDTILYQLYRVTFENGIDPKDAVLFVRMPRSGLQGDFSGPWMLYFSFPSQNNVMQSDWIITEEDGTAKVGEAIKMNAITAQRSVLLENSADWKWEKQGQTLSLVSK